MTVRSLILAGDRGREMVSNPGNPFVHTTGWFNTQASPTLSVEAGRLRITSTQAAASRASIAIACVIGRRYTVTISLEATTDDTNLIVSPNSGLTSGVASSTVAQTKRVETLTFTATAATMYVGGNLVSDLTGDTLDINSISVRRA